VRSALEAWKSGDAEKSLESLHPDVRLDVRFRPDGKVWHGREGWRRGMSEWVSTWSGWHFEIERYIDVGDDRVVVLFHESGRAKGSGLPMSESGVTVNTIRDGMIASSVLSLDRERVLEELGLSVTQENAHREQLARFYNAFNARDLPAVLAILHPEIEFESRFARAGGTTYSGHAGVSGWFSDLADAWEYIVVHLGPSREVAADRTIALITLRGKGRASGIELDEDAAHELSWRDGKLARLVYVDLATAREAVGVQE
jgi:ketosteroid isomerase-like protein